MGTTVVFDLVDRLVEIFREQLSEVNVYDGTGNSDDPGDYLMVGVSDPDNDRPQIVESRQSWAGLGARARDEEGAVACVALSWNGKPEGAAEARAKVKAITEKVEQVLRSDPSLGGTVPGLQWTGYGSNASADLVEADDGTALLWRFEIAFKARI